MDANYRPLVFSVVVPVDNKILPYYMTNCPFDFSKSKTIDLKDD